MANNTKSFGVFCYFMYNKLVKKLKKVLFSMLWVIPIFLGIIFSTNQLMLYSKNYKESIVSSQEARSWGEGEDFFKNGNFSGFQSDLFGDNLDSGNGVDSIEIKEYEYRFFDDYYVDLQVPTSKENTTITGDGSEDNPYQINSIEDFLFAFKFHVSPGHFEINCDIILNDECFDENGSASGGDGIVYQWKPRGVGKIHIDAKGHVIKGLYINDTTLDYAGLFGYNWIGSFKNATFDNWYIKAKKNVCAISFDVNEISNCSLKNSSFLERYL